VKRSETRRYIERDEQSKGIPSPERMQTAGRRAVDLSQVADRTQRRHTSRQIDAPNLKQLRVRRRQPSGEQQQEARAKSEEATCAKRPAATNDKAKTSDKRECHRRLTSNSDQGRQNKLVNSRGHQTRQAASSCETSQRKRRGTARIPRR